MGNKTLKAHRCILGQHSEVFRSMFAQESMLEAQRGIIDIMDSRFEPVGHSTSNCNLHARIRTSDHVFFLVMAVE